MMMGISHWGLFEVDGQAKCHPQAFDDAIWARFVNIFSKDWDNVLERRFPNGVAPQQTPLMRLLSK